MNKIRQRDQMDLRHENLGRHFSWIDTVIPISSFLGGMSETWNIKFRKDISTISEEKQKFEDFIREFFVGKMRKKGVIFCYQHKGVVIMVQ